MPTVPLVLTADSSDVSAQLCIVLRSVYFFLHHFYVCSILTIYTVDKDDAVDADDKSFGITNDVTNFNNSNSSSGSSSGHAVLSSRGSYTTDATATATTGVIAAGLRGKAKEVSTYVNYQFEYDYEYIMVSITHSLHLSLLQYVTTTMQVRSQVMPFVVSRRVSD